MATTTTTTLPWELIIDILSRLGVDDLLRYRAVCKPWRSLVDGPRFIELHLTRSAQTRLMFGGRNDLFWADPRHMSGTPQRLSYPLDTGTGIAVLGSCNGLVSIVNPKTGDMAIWNPSTRKHVVLPKQKDPPLHQGAVIKYGIGGMGYDSINNDIKFVCLMIYRSRFFTDLVFHVVEAYSLKAKAWKRVKDFPAHLSYSSGSAAVLLHNSLHWSVTRESDCTDVLLAFDMASDETSVLPLPDHPDLKQLPQCVMKTTKLGGRLCISAIGEANFALGRSERIDIWVMQEYGVRESWMRLFSVGPLSPTGFFDTAVPLMYLERSEGEGGGGDHILLNWSGDSFAVYDMKNNSVEHVNVPGIQRIIDSVACVTSLVGVGGDGREESTRKEAGDSRKEGGEKQKPKSSDNKKKRDDFLSKGFKLVL